MIRIVNSFHQGKDNFNDHGLISQEKADVYYNRQYVDNPMLSIHQVDYILWFDGHLKVKQWFVCLTNIL